MRRHSEQNVSAFTIDLVAILEVKEWIVVDVTMKVNSRSKRKKKVSKL